MCSDLEAESMIKHQVLWYKTEFNLKFRETRRHWVLWPIKVAVSLELGFEKWLSRQGESLLGRLRTVSRTQRWEFIWRCDGGLSMNRVFPEEQWESGQHQHGGLRHRGRVWQVVGTDLLRFSFLGTWTVPGMRRSRTWWPFNTTGRSSTERAGSSGQAVNCWSGMGTSTARSWASNGEASGRASSRQGKVGTTSLPNREKRKNSPWKLPQSSSWVKPCLKSVEVQFRCLRNKGACHMHRTLRNNCLSFKFLFRFLKYFMHKLYNRIYW